MRENTLCDSMFGRPNGKEYDNFEKKISRQQHSQIYFITLKRKRVDHCTFSGYGLVKQNKHRITYVFTNCT